MSTVQQLLNVLKKTFYDLTPVSNKQMSLMPMANGGIGFVNTKPILLSFALLGSIMADQNRIVVTSQISTRLQRLRQQVSNPVSSIIHATTENNSKREIELKKTNCTYTFSTRLKNLFLIQKNSWDSL